MTNEILLAVKYVIILLLGFWRLVDTAFDALEREIDSLEKVLIGLFATFSFSSQFSESTTSDISLSVEI